MAIEKVAAGVGAKHITSVAIAYLLQKAPYIFLIVGGRMVEHLLANLEGLEISLTDEKIQSLESEVEFDPGFPSWFIGDGSKPVFLMTASGHTYKPLIQPLLPSAGKQ